ncbi:MAG: four helix bundle protein [Dehalococcoidia bacterium]
MAVTRFQDIIAWQRARTLAAEVYRVTSDGPLSKDFGLRDQARRASVSIMANIAEGFGRNRPAELQRFLDIAQGSCAELQSHLYVVADLGYVEAAVHEKLQLLCDEVGRLIRRFAQSSASAARGTRDEGLGTRDGAP